MLNYDYKRYYLHHYTCYRPIVNTICRYRRIETATPTKQSKITHPYRNATYVAL